MEKLIACCGLNCAECGAYQATMTDNDDLRAKTSEEWSKLYGSDIPPESINCAGCNGNGVLFYYPTVCEYRKCVKERGLHTCAECPDYACENLQKFFEMAPAAKQNLEELRK
jgi:hypothetical protein